MIVGILAELQKSGKSVALPVSTEDHHSSTAGLFRHPKSKCMVSKASVLHAMTECEKSEMPRYVILIHDPPAACTGT